MPQDDPKKKRKVPQPGDLGFVGPLLEDEFLRYANRYNRRPLPRSEDHPEAKKVWTVMPSSYDNRMMEAAENVGLGGGYIENAMGLLDALNNTFMYDTLYSTFGTPKIEKHERIKGLRDYLRSDNGDGTYTVSRADYQPYYDRIRLKQGSYPEDDFGFIVTHELGHRAQSKGLPEDLPFREELTKILQDLEVAAGPEGSANAIAAALRSIRMNPEGSREDHYSHAARVPQHLANSPEYYWSEEDAKQAVDFWYRRLNRE